MTSHAADDEDREPTPLALFHVDVSARSLQVDSGNAPVDDAGWWADVTSALREMARTGKPFQIHDLRVRFDLDEPPNPKVDWARVASWGRRHGIIRPVGATRSGRRTVTGSLVHVWIGTAEWIDQQDESGVIVQFPPRTTRDKAGPAAA